jgi:hypothetical protein
MDLNSLSDYIPVVRESIFDYAPKNYILDNEEEFGPAEISRALERALERFINMPPNIGTFSITGFPAPMLLVDMAIIELMQASSIKRLRNTVVYSDAGLSIDDQNWTAYQKMVDALIARTYPYARDVKANINLGRGFKCIPSIYSGI